MFTKQNRRIRRTAVCTFATAALFFVTATSLTPAIWAETDPDDIQAKFERIKEIKRAQELYVLGENCYKNGFVEEAVRYWMQVLDLKPDSDYTRKQLQKARSELITDYTKRAQKYRERGDYLSAYILLESIAHLVPEEQSYAQALNELENKLTEQYRTAKDAYKKAISYFADRNYPKAKEAIDLALRNGGSSLLISEAARAINDAYIANRYSVELLPQDLFTTREVAFENYFWQHEKTITKSVPTADRGSINKSIGCYSLRGRLRNITLTTLSKVTIRAQVLEKKTGKHIADVEGVVMDLKPGASAEVVFTKPTGKTLDAIVTITLTEVAKDLSATMTVTKSTRVRELEAVCGYASLDDKEDIGSFYKIEAYDITAERAGTGTRVEQNKLDYRVKQNY